MLTTCPLLFPKTQGISSAGKSIPQPRLRLDSGEGMWPSWLPYLSGSTLFSSWTREEGCSQMERSCSPGKRHGLHCSVLCLRVISAPACKLRNKRRVQYSSQPAWPQHRWMRRRQPKYWTHSPITMEKKLFVTGKLRLIGLATPSPFSLAYLTSLNCTHFHL